MHVDLNRYPEVSMGSDNDAFSVGSSNASVDLDTAGGLDASAEGTNVRNRGKQKMSDSTDKTAAMDEEEGADAIRQKLAKKETQNVFRLRVLVLKALVLAAIAVSIVVYFVTYNAETDEFETQFKGAAVKVAESFENIAAQRIAAISSLGVAAIAHGVDHLRQWPFVCLSSFQQRSSTARASSKALVVSIAPTVTQEDRAEWEKNYVSGDDSYWLGEGYAYQEDIGIDVLDKSRHNTQDPFDPETGIYYHDADGNHHRATGDGPFLPYWETSPLMRDHFVNQNVLNFPDLSEYATTSLTDETVVFGGMITAPAGGATNVTLNPTDTSYFATLLSFEAGEEVEYQGDPMTYVFIPIFDSFMDSRRSIGIMLALINWASYFAGILPPNVRGVQVVLQNPCYGQYTYEIDGSDVKRLGFGDIHDVSFNYLRSSATFDNTHSVEDGTKTGLPLDQGLCPYSIDIYPSEVFYKTYKTKNPVYITLAVSSMFFFTVVLFIIYDRLVERRQKVVLSRAVQSSALVSSLFPKNVRERLLRANDGDAFVPQNHRIKNFLRGDNAKTNRRTKSMVEEEEQPIADLFPNCTVLFADIAGFTSWSSARDPSQVFRLLQTVYQAFDKIAKNRKVFKVETIGDSYVAATGLPEHQDKHYLIMARFAHECNLKMQEVTRNLEVSLGPDTGELQMRFGLHSGPVTAGVLLGDRARFQLFGDTVNTAARMESTGVKGKIQLSQATAELIMGAGKEHWVVPREEEVQVKGKGTMKTYWLRLRGSDQGTLSTVSSGNQSAIVSTATLTVGAVAREKKERLVDWMVELFADHIKKLIAKNRQTIGRRERLTFVPPAGKTCLDEVVEVIKMPKFDARTATKASDYISIEIKPSVLKQLREYVSIIAATYRDNRFHNFEHACHVTMSVSKLLKRVVAPEISDMELQKIRKGKSGAMASALHDYTHGINSDPLSSLAIVFSALIHDADHRGVSNVQLMKEQPEMAVLYKQKSVAEQNSLDISWNLFMSDQFSDLRACLFATRNDLLRFRQVIVNVVLATDIFDKELNDLRRLRWDKAFAESSSTSMRSDEEATDLKATIVIEHIIQASDVSHTMQHWHIYRKWNERLFQEMYLAHKNGRMGTNPVDFWYDGELAFFDKYIIPLAKKLKECNVFGVSSDEYLTYAMANREEWQRRGKDVIAEMMSNLAEEESSKLLEEKEEEGEDYDTNSEV